MTHPTTHTSQKPEFPETWVVAGTKDMASLVVWMNGVNLTARCIAFEKLYTAGTAYWGTVCVLVKVGILGFDPNEPVPMPMVYAFRRGLIVWEDVENLFKAGEA